MNIHTPTSLPSASGGPKGQFGHKALLAFAASVALAAIIAGGLWLRADYQRSGSRPVPSRTVVQAESLPRIAGQRVNSGYSAHTVYVVASEPQAKSVWAGISEANAIRASIGESLLSDEVLVAVSDDVATSVVAAESAANEILVTQYGVENRIVDLRG